MIDIDVGMSYQSPQCFKLYKLVLYAAKLLLLCLLHEYIVEGAVDITEYS